MLRVWVSPRPSPDPDRYEHRFAHVDVLIVGSGAAGLAAAEAAAAMPGNERILLVEADHEFGGGMLASADDIERVTPMAWHGATRHWPACAPCPT